MDSKSEVINACEIMKYNIITHWRNSFLLNLKVKLLTRENNTRNKYFQEVVC